MTGSHAITATVTVLLAIIGLAIVAELLSASSQTGSVLKSFGGAFGTMICVALRPITNGDCGTSVTSILHTS